MSFPSEVKKLSDYWEREILKGKKYRFPRVISRAAKSKRASFLFWFRLAYVWHRSESAWKRSIASRVGIGIYKKYGADIDLDAEIGAGLRMGHPVGVVITGKSRIGENCEIRQNTTIGLSDSDGFVRIGNDVDIGCSSVILGGDVTIGDRVVIGAMSFVNASIPNDSVVVTEKTLKIRSR